MDCASGREGTSCIMVRKTLSAETPVYMSDEESLWVVFSDETDLKRLKLLKRGFRHCFAVMKQNGQWILVDPRSNKTDIVLLPHPAHFNLPRYFADKNMRVLRVMPLPDRRRVAPCLPASCVETVKRLVGVHSWRVLTPYQLYKYLNTSQKGS